MMGAPVENIHLWKELHMTGPKAARGEIKDTILTAARELFSTRDYPDVTVRAIAKRAGCDAGMISYYFGSKVGVFRAAMSLPQDPVEVVATAFGDGGPGTGERVVGEVLRFWEESFATTNVQLLVRSLLENEKTLAVFREWLDRTLFTTLAHQLGTPDAKLRIQFAAGQIVGLCVLRFIYKSEPLASMPASVLVRQLGPIIDIHLFGPIIPRTT